MGSPYHRGPVVRGRGRREPANSFGPFASRTGLDCNNRATVCLAIDGDTVWGGRKSGLHRIDQETGAYLRKVDVGVPTIHVSGPALDRGGGRATLAGPGPSVISSQAMACPRNRRQDAAHSRAGLREKRHRRGLAERGHHQTPRR